MKKSICLICLTGLVLLFGSCKNDDIPPGFTRAAEPPQARFAHTAKVETRQVTRHHKAVGTIRPLTESRIEARVSGQVLKISANPGDRVEKGDVLVVLDARQLESRLGQAREGTAYAGNRLTEALKGVDEAKASLEQARAAYERTRTLFEKQIVASQQLEIDKAAFLTAKARLEKANQAVAAARASVRQSQEVVREAQIAQAYTRITAPESGVVVRRLVDPGDQAMPGKPLLEIQTSGSLRLEANVREGLIRYIEKDRSYDVEIQTVGKTVGAVVREIVPYADPDTRTFLVKATLPDTPGVYPGMFGRLLIPVEEQATLVIPAGALIRVGQLEMVNVLDEKGGYKRIYIKTGSAYEDKLEVLSGLSGDETLGW